MKKLLIVAGLIAALLIAMPYVTGRVAESVTQQLTEQLNENSAEYGLVEFKEYDRGLRSTDALLTWQVPAQYQALFNQPIEVRCEGRHGITNFSYQCKAQNVPNYTEFVAEYLNGQDPLAIGGEVSVFGAATQTVELAPFSITGDEGETFETQAGKLEIATDKSLRVFNIFGQLDGFSLTTESDIVTVAPAEMNGEISINEHGLAIGEVGITIDGLALNSGKDGNLKFGEIEMRSATAEQGDTMSMDYQLNIDRVGQTGVAGDDAQAMDDIDLTLGISGINMAELAEITERLQQLSQFDSDQALSNEQEANRNAQALAMLPELEDLLTTGLNMQVDLAANYAGEAVTAEMGLELLKDLSLGDFILLSVQPQAFFSKLDFQLSNRIPSNLIETNQASAQAMANNSFYEKSGQHYEVALSVSESGIKLNGQDLSIEELMAKMSAAQ